jgi:hypothetical protein
MRVIPDRIAASTPALFDARLRHDQVMERVSDPLTLRLVGVAAALDLPGLGPRVEQAVALAVDLLVADRATPATAAVAALGAGATLRDSGEDIRQMLREQGVEPPPPSPGEEPAYTTALWAVGEGGLSIGEFSVVFYKYLPAWTEQDDDQRKIVVLLHEWESETDPETRRPITDALREAARAAAGP